uniref:ARAD1D07304p n=1 Tax=Blastobotrys adeninivorans TaxID=409370 RepID=A0A060T904_BLAAD
MPLITLTGFPSSGKTTRGKELETKLKQRIADQGLEYNVVLIPDESKKEDYWVSQKEKPIRGDQLAAVKRHISKSTIVILDGPNYIKGFRYQLFCEAKALTTNSCIVHVGTSKEKCEEWNAQRDPQDQWPKELMDALVFRYEEPNGMNRWDAPLFTVVPEDEMPVDDILDALRKKAKPPNQATVLKAAPPTNYLSDLDRVTMDIVNEVMQQFGQTPGGDVKIEGHEVTLPMQLTLPQLHRIRRNFIMLNKMKPMEISRIKDMFIAHLEKYWEVD